MHSTKLLILPLVFSFWACASSRLDNVSSALDGGSGPGAQPAAPVVPVVPATNGGEPAVPPTEPAPPIQEPPIAQDPPPVDPPSPPPPAGALPQLRGVNLSGADWGEGALPGTFGVNYFYPNHGEVDHFMGLGMNVFRVPFRWERLQRQQYGAFDGNELARLDDIVGYATKKGAYVLIDPHNYARYYGAVIGAGTPVEAFADFWGKLAAHYKGNARVIFGIMNEPMSMSTEVWLSDANAAIAAIRATGATQLILVPGNAWTGAHSWLQSWYGTANGTVMSGIDDPLDNFAIEAHQYVDPNSSGTDMGTCVSSTIGSERLAAFTGWLKTHKLKGFLGEFGAGTSATCLAALDDLLGYLDANPEQWIGWSYWAAGPGWGNTAYDIEPDNGVDRPQTGVLVKHLK